MDGVLVRYGEIGIKSQPVRRMMQSRLKQNLLDAMLRDGVEGNVESLGSRLWLVGSDLEALVDLACRTFGVVSASPAKRVGSSMEQLSAAAIEVAMGLEWTKFAVRPRRQGKHPFKSQDVGIQVGSAIFKAAEAAGRTPKVDLDDPDVEISIDVRGEGAFIHTTSRTGPGGLPLGTQGKVAVLLSDTASAVAAWFMMRRGCAVQAIHAGDMGSAPMDLTDPLKRWGLNPNVIILPVCSGKVTKEGLIEAASTVARRKKLRVIVTGDTLHSRLVTGDLPVLRPVCGLAPEEIRRIQLLAGIPDEDGPGIIDDGGEDASGLLRLQQVVAV